MITLEAADAGRPVEIGAMVSVSVVQASNLIRDVRELITNTFGGRMRRYESLLDGAIERGLAQFREALAAEGYDGALGVRFAHPQIVAGGAELIIYGTGFRYRDQATTPALKPSDADG